MPENVTPTLINGQDVPAYANTHINWGNSNVYYPPEEIADQIIDSGLTGIRERWSGGNKNQQKAFKRLAQGGVRLYLTIGAMDSSLDDIDNDIATWKASGLVEATVGICGPNEPNKSDNPDKWPDNLLKKQKRIFNQVTEVPVSLGALKYNVKNYSRDLSLLASHGITKFCKQGDFHYYPGNKGPIVNDEEAQRARDLAFEDRPLWQSETGWTRKQTPAGDQTRWTTEALLRSYLRKGMSGTCIYEFLSEGSHASSAHEGQFGPDWGPTTALLTCDDTGQPFPGWIASAGEPNATYDGTALCTSDDDGWTLYLLASKGSKQNDFTLVLPDRFSTDLTVPAKAGSGGNKRWENVPITASLTTVRVTQ